MPDRRKASGEWVRSWTITSEQLRIQYHTRSGRLWTSMVDRCTAGTRAQEKAKSYKGCTLGFSGYQEFAEWCQSQPGYLEAEHNGNYWCIDKDILFPGNKVYSAETCLFVPSRVNNLFVYGDKSKTTYPVGVSLRGGCATFSMTCRKDGEAYIRAGFRTVEDAHRAWQVSKISDIRKESTNPRLGDRLRSALLRRADIIQYEHDHGLPTINL